MFGSFFHAFFLLQIMPFLHNFSMFFALTSKKHLNIYIIWDTLSLPDEFFTFLIFLFHFCLSIFETDTFFLGHMFGFFFHAFFVLQIMPFFHNFSMFFALVSKKLLNIYIIWDTLSLPDKLSTFLIFLFHHLCYFLDSILDWYVFIFRHMVCFLFDHSFSLTVFSPLIFLFSLLDFLFTLLLSFLHHLFKFLHSIFEFYAFFFGHVFSTLLHTFF